MLPPESTDDKRIGMRRFVRQVAFVVVPNNCHHYCSKFRRFRGAELLARHVVRFVGAGGFGIPNQGVQPLFVNPLIETLSKKATPQGRYQSYLSVRPWTSVHQAIPMPPIEMIPVPEQHGILQQDVLSKCHERCVLRISPPVGPGYSGCAPGY
jgi:hypothetical protein